MSSQDFMLALLGSLADIRAALWALTTAASATATTVLVHALVTRRRRRGDR